MYLTDQWYLLLNAGYMLPAAAGTDLPNHPAREWWQPFLGGIRTYVRVGDRIDFETWAAQLKAGASFITSGPLLHLEVNGAGPGGVVHLPEGGGEVEVRARIENPRPLVSLEIVQSGTPLEAKPRKIETRGIHRWEVTHRLRVTESCWVAVRGTGGRIPIFEEVSATKVDEIAHTSAIQILVGGRPIGSAASIRPLMQHLRRQREHYRTEAKFERDEHRARMLGLFDEALVQLTRRSGSDFLSPAIP